jgi:hypothetical protein
MNLDPETGEPSAQHIQVEVRFILPRRLMWLLAGIAIGNVDLGSDLLEKTSPLIRIVLPE